MELRRNVEKPSRLGHPRYDRYGVARIQLARRSFIFEDKTRRYAIYGRDDTASHGRNCHRRKRSEVRVNAYVTSSTGETALKAKRFERFSDWTVLQRAIAYLITKIKQQKASNNTCSTEHGRKDKDDDQQPTVKERSKAAKIVIIKAVQSDVFAEEIDALKRRDSKEAESRNQLKERRRLLRKSNLVRLDPFLDRDGILRVGGRLNRSSLTFEEKHPILLPKKHHLSQLIIRHYHEKVVHHQGRQITHGAVRQAGFWVVNGHGETSRIIRACVTCKKLRGRTLTQHMADLPADRTETHPPFTNVGMDVFGPWHIQVKKLRGAAANAKRWGLVFTCLSSRGIHIEVLHSMDANSFICALRRFFAIRGPAAILRCDCGTNFVGAKSELDGSLKEMDKERVQRYVTEQGCEWKFNPPHASHFGGVWERQIGTIRRVLDAMLLKIGAAQLDDELLLTLMAEVSSIVNNRPITAVSADTDTQFPVTIDASYYETETAPFTTGRVREGRSLHKKALEKSSIPRGAILVTFETRVSAKPSVEN